MKGQFAGLVAALLLLAAKVGAAASGSISLDVRDADIVDVLRLLAIQSGVSVIADESLRHQRISLHLRDVSFEQAVAVLSEAYDLEARHIGTVLIVGSSTAMNRKYASSNGGSGPKTSIFTVSNARPDDLVKPLSDSLIPGTIIVPDKRTSTLIVTGNAATIRRAQTLIHALDAAAAGPGTPLAAAIPLKYARSIDAVRQLKGLIPEGTYVADDKQNAILVTGGAPTMTVARDLLRAIDVATPQVLFDVSVVDITLANDQSNIGVLFGGPSGAGSATVGQTTWIFRNNTIPIFATINFLVQKGQARILAQPRIATLNNREASMLIGTSYPIVTTVASTGATSQNVSYVDIGVKLKITPTVGADGSVTADLHPEYSTIGGFLGGFPIIDRRTVDSVLRVQSGETIIIGGLVTDSSSETLTKVPLIGDVPVLGELFRNREKTHSRGDVVFLLTPHVL